MRAIIIKDGKIEEKDAGFIDPGWSGRNEQYDQPMPVDGFILWDTDGEKVVMRQIHVDKFKRKHGFGTTLFWYLLCIAKELKVNRIETITTTSDKEPFGLLLKRVGYKRVKENLFMKEL